MPNISDECDPSPEITALRRKSLRLVTLIKQSIAVRC